MSIHLFCTKIQEKIETLRDGGKDRQDQKSAGVDFAFLEVFLKKSKFLELAQCDIQIRKLLVFIGPSPVILKRAKRNLHSANLN